MTPLVKAITALPEKQIILMVRILITHQLSDLLNKAKMTKVNPEEVENIRNLEVVQALPNAEKEEIYVMCDRALNLINRAF
jgi:hypothetical protein